MTEALRRAACRALDQLAAQGFEPDRIVLDGKHDYLAHAARRAHDREGRPDACCRSRPRRWSPRSTRDAMMAEEAEHFPAYGFESNRGYPAPVHKCALAGVRAVRRSTGGRGSSWSTACGAASRATSAQPRLFAC